MPYKQGHAFAEVRRTEGRRFDHERERGAHQRGGHDEDAEGDAEANQRQERQRVRAARGRPDVQLSCSQSSALGVARAVTPTSTSHGAEPKQRTTHAIREPARGEASDGESSHEARPDRAGGVGCHAKHETEQPKPQDLIDQRADAGTEKQNQKRWQKPGLTRMLSGRDGDSNSVEKHTTRARAVPSASLQNQRNDRARARPRTGLRDLAGVVSPGGTDARAGSTGSTVEVLHLFQRETRLDAGDSIDAREHVFQEPLVGGDVGDNHPDADSRRPRSSGSTRALRDAA